MTLQTTLRCWQKFEPACSAKFILQKSLRQNADQKRNCSNKKLQKTDQGISISKLKHIAIELFSVSKSTARGFWQTFRDLIQYCKIAVGLKLGYKNVDKLTKEELENYHQFPKDFQKLSVVLFLGMIPVVYYYAVYLIFRDPYRYVTHHFWTRKQKELFAKRDMERKWKLFPIVWSELETLISNMPKSELKIQFQELMSRIQSGHIPSVEELLDVKNVFANHNDDCDMEIKGEHQLKYLNHLADILEIKSNEVSRLLADIYILQRIDKHLVKEGIEHKKPQKLQRACEKRGLYCENNDREMLLKYLSTWIQLSIKCKGTEQLIFLLHAPVLITYGQVIKYSGSQA